MIFCNEHKDLQDKSRIAWLIHNTITNKQADLLKKETSERVAELIDERKLKAYNTYKFVQGYLQKCRLILLNKTAPREIKTSSVQLN